MKNKRMFLAGAAVLVLAIPARANSITFDDFKGDYGAIPNGYQSFDWNNFSFVNSAFVTSLLGPNGYANGTVSSPNVALDNNGTAASFSSATPFNLASGDFTAAWNNGLNLEVQVYSGATKVADNNYTLNTTSADLISFNIPNVTSVDFIPSGGTSAGYAGSGQQFALDNLTISIAAAPEPSQVVSGLVLAGLGGVSLLGRRLRQRK